MLESSSAETPSNLRLEPEWCNFNLTRSPNSTQYSKKTCVPRSPKLHNIYQEASNRTSIEDGGYTRSFDSTKKGQRSRSGCVKTKPYLDDQDRAMEQRPRANDFHQEQRPLSGGLLTVRPETDPYADYTPSGSGLDCLRGVRHHRSLSCRAGAFDMSTDNRGKLRRAPDAIHCCSRGSFSSLPGCESPEQHSRWPSPPNGVYSGQFKGSKLADLSTSSLSIRRAPDGATELSHTPNTSFSRIVDCESQISDTDSIDRDRIRRQLSRTLIPFPHGANNGRSWPCQKSLKQQYRPEKTSSPAERISPVMKKDPISLMINPHPIMAKKSSSKHKVLGEWNVVEAGLNREPSDREDFYQSLRKKSIKNNRTVEPDLTTLLQRSVSETSVISSSLKTHSDHDIKEGRESVNSVLSLESAMHSYSSTPTGIESVDYVPPSLEEATILRKMGWKGPVDVDPITYEEIQAFKAQYMNKKIISEVDRGSSQSKHCIDDRLRSCECSPIEYLSAYHMIGDDGASDPILSQSGSL